MQTVGYRNQIAKVQRIGSDGVELMLPDGSIVTATLSEISGSEKEEIERIMRVTAEVEAKLSRAIDVDGPLK